MIRDRLLVTHKRGALSTAPMGWLPEFFPLDAMHL